MAKDKIFGVRMDDKTRYGLEVLSAIAGYGSASKLITDAIDDKLKEVRVIRHADDGSEVAVSSAEALNEIWHPDEIIRFAKIAPRYPGFMTDEQRQIWRFVAETPVLWLNGKWKERADGSKFWDVEKIEQNLDTRLLREFWADYVAAAHGDISLQELEQRIDKKLPKRRAAKKR